MLLFAGAAAGGLAGYFLFFWAIRQGFYGMVLPGSLLGFGAGLFQNRSIPVCILCGLSSCALGLLTEWRFAPFIKDSSLRFFVLHVHELKPITLLMIGLGSFFGFYLPFRNIKKTIPAQKAGPS